MCTKTVFINALLYDGTGQPPRPADVTIQGDTIEEIALPETASTKGAQIVQAQGLALAPGLLDVHGHSDTTLIKAPTAEAKISQGVTTELTGNCGCSKCIEVFPEWDTLPGYAKALNQARPAIHSATFCGHNSLRERVMGYEDRPATRQELQRMKDILRQALQDGACGFSGGLWYLPGKYAPTEEMLELAPLLKHTGKPYANHMRSEGDGLLEALDEAIAIARHGDNKLQVSHLKAAPQRNWDKIFKVFDTIEYEQSQGLEVYADRYPFTYSCTGLRQVLPPPWSRIKDLQSLFQDPQQAQAAAHVLDRTKSPQEDWQKIILLDPVHLASHAPGMTVWDLAQELQLSPGTLTVRILSQQSPSAAFGKMSERNVDLILSKPWVFASSDASAVPFDGSLGRAHPRAFGTFPKFFQLACRHARPEQVIHRMTDLPARFFQIPRRGRITPGYVADLLLFQPEAYQSQATYASPHQPASGVVSVYVSGQLAYDGATHRVLARHGQFLSIPNQDH